MVNDQVCSKVYFWNILFKVNHSWTWLWAHSVVKVTFFLFDENEKDAIFEQTEHVGVLAYTLHMAGDSSLN